MQLQPQTRYWYSDIIKFQNFELNVKIYTLAILKYVITVIYLQDITLCDEIAQMVKRQTVVPEDPGSNPAAGKFFRAMLQRVTSNRVYKIPTKRTYNWIPVYTAR